MLVKKNDYKERNFRGFSYLLGATGERMMLTLMQFKKDDEVSPHEHPNEQAGYCLRGKFELKAGEEKFMVERGDSYLIEGNTRHSYKFFEDSRMVEVFSPPRE